jgi:predicted dehydrogenase
VPIALAAAKAGKDVYLEKPLGLSIEQAFAARQIEEKYNRIFQYGTQNRSTAQVRMGTELVLNGHIGEVKEVYLWSPPSHAGGSVEPVLPVPDGWDYDLWLGPAPEAPFCHDRCLRDGPGKGIFHIRDYTVGFISGWGTHPMDMLMWWADAEGLGTPVKYEGTGTIPTQGLFDCVTHYDVTCTFANGLRVRFTDTPSARRKKSVPNIEQMEFDHGTMYVGETGTVAVSRGSWKSWPDELLKRAKNAGDRRLPVSTSHPANFIDSVIARTKPISTLESAIRTEIATSLSDICIRTGRPITWDPKNNTIVGDEEAAAMMKRGPMRAPWKLEA